MQPWQSMLKVLQVHADNDLQKSKGKGYARVGSSTRKCQNEPSLRTLCVHLVTERADLEGNSKKAGTSEKPVRTFYTSRISSIIMYFPIWPCVTRI